MANMDKIQDKLDLLPAKPGCYMMKDKHGTIIYVGKAKKLNNRVRSYFRGVHDTKTTRLVQNIDDFETIVTDSEKESLILEINLIKKYTPKYNIMFMDDKSYPYIMLTKDKAPVLSVIRNPKRKDVYYFGPFPDAGAAHKTKDLLNKIYPLRKCKHMPNRACLYYHLGQCLAPCIHDIDPEIYQKMATEIRKFLNGDTKAVVDQLKNRMMEASEKMDYERAQEYHELILSIDHVASNQHVEFADKKDQDAFNYYYDKGYLCIQGFFIRGGKILDRALSVTPIYEEVEDAFVSFLMQYYQKNPYPQILYLPKDIQTDLSEVFPCKIIKPQRGEKLRLMEMVKENAKKSHIDKFELVKRKDENRNEALEELSNLLGKKISTIEIYDNSHISGAFNVSGMVVFKDGKPSKKDYRTYKLDTYVSDTDSMKEVIYRRYFRLLKEQGKTNDLLIVDGGLGQIHAAKEILDGLDIDITLCGLVKDDKHRTASLMDSEGNILPVKKDQPLFFLLTQMQDEVHRFAITFHKKLRSKAQTKSILDEIPGLGSVRRKKLWNHYKSMKKMKAASVEELTELVPKQVAENVYRIIHEEKKDF
ncbi:MULTISPECIES: excinuclease ABC subunit UvrC [unclassified Breznakia]|uniref:excinuclease ABC subunit UvrC n=1 Tax=unclassified Breznakia TaxID=2623764 RepID=UPI002476B565|nr:MULTISPECIES: excinuclease ABC subunit UvrC [unclassified Breznakia]MDH6366040.1 excinuclease ABC subunit C [Breznakia sp. PH1-1]MDH6403028.1 excinuclease ABC subunit C [Breznakia sp. PF1-11]MDH6410737.1 excinuclease ABC subunit C [Breznakia sp. PFB1-11]MDH6413206.1 excinuclease ABC subunit C [Breznakia sp. PFB1-14]MDH6415574.1 excinuclease ABC subunit C [Breznakia sp. PFB1-4]